MALAMLESSNLLDLGMFGGGNSFKLIIICGYEKTDDSGVVDKSGVAHPPACACG